MGHTEYGDDEEKEAEAKFFAKYALAPPPLIHNMEGPITPKTIRDTFRISHRAAVYAFKYYHSWLDYGASDYTDYESRMLKWFNCIGA